MGLNLKALIGKLNHQARATLEGAAGLCLSRTHYDIEIEHYLMSEEKLIESEYPTLNSLRQESGLPDGWIDLTKSNAESKHPYVALDCEMVQLALSLQILY